MSADEQRIREFAYQIWESEGKPDGHSSRHWEMARKLVEAEQSASLKAPASKRASKAKADANDAPPVAKPRSRKAIAPVETQIPVKPKPAKSKSAATKPDSSKTTVKPPKN